MKVMNSGVWCYYGQRSQDKSIIFLSTLIWLVEAGETVFTSQNLGSIYTLKQTRDKSIYLWEGKVTTQTIGSSSEEL